MIKEPILTDVYIAESCGSADSSRMCCEILGSILAQNVDIFHIPTRFLYKLHRISK
jgi:hypothetical protein